MDHAKLSASLSANVPIALKIIIKLDYLERLFWRSWSSGGARAIEVWSTV